LNQETEGMSSVSIESIALHIVRHLVRGMGKTEGQGASIQSIRHWWTMSLGQRGENFELGLDYADQSQWVKRGPDNIILLTTLGSEKGAASR
jgi:hypothetical protein